jgi:hypothetical protein
VQVNIQPVHHRSSPNDSEYSEQSSLSHTWTLRKQAALLLDHLCSIYPSRAILPLALPLIQVYLQHEEVLVREQGMLALGALCNGAMADCMVMYVPSLFAFLLRHLGDRLSEMRCISAWVLSKISRVFDRDRGEAVEGEEGVLYSPSRPSPGGVGVKLERAQGEAFYIQTLYAILYTMCDVIPKVQVAACSALCLLIENSFIAHGPEGRAQGNNILLPHLDILFLYIQYVFSLYGYKAQLILIDTLGTLADTLGSAFRSYPCCPQVVNEMIQRYALSLHPVIAERRSRIPAVAERGNMLSESVSIPERGDASYALSVIAERGIQEQQRYIQHRIECYFPSILYLFTTLEDHDYRLYPLLECFTSLMTILATDILAYLPYIYIRCVRLLCCASLPYESFLHLLAQLHKGLPVHSSNSAHSSITTHSNNNAYRNDICAPMGSSGLGGGDGGGMSKGVQEMSLAPWDVYALLANVCHYDDTLPKDIAICVCDVISALCEHLQHEMCRLLYNTNHILVHMVLMLCKDSIPEVRQSAFSLAGELCKVAVRMSYMMAGAEEDIHTQLGNLPSPPAHGNSHVMHHPSTPAHSSSNSVFPAHPNDTTPTHVNPTHGNHRPYHDYPHLISLLEICILNLDVQYPLVCNNAAWTIGELLIALHAQVEEASGMGASREMLQRFVSRYVTRMMHQLIMALQSIDIADNLKVMSDCCLPYARCLLAGQAGQQLSAVVLLVTQRLVASLTHNMYDWSQLPSSGSLGSIFMYPRSLNLAGS